MSTIVVVGRAGAGKTELSKAISAQSDYIRVNVGDLLDHELARAGIRAITRSEIGPRFMDEFGLDRYLALVVDAASRGQVVLDGLRIARALPALRTRGPVVVVYRTSPSSLEADESEYARGLEAMRREVDIVVPWCEDVAEVPSAARTVLELALRR